MKTAAVICEYNPMHEGHTSMLGQIRRKMGEDCCILCLMSGDYVQRGEPAVYDKYARARTAVENGADLVLELPYPWSASVAESFASGAVGILDGFGGIDALFFGSENKSAKELYEIAALTSGKEFIDRLAALRKSERTLSYPRLFSLCYETVTGRALQLCPNEILGCEYLKQISRLGCTFEAEALPMKDGFSASGERARIRARGEAEAAFLENGERAIIAHLLLSGGTDRFSRQARRAASLSDLFALTRTPADTDARLKRELLSVLFSSSGREKERPRFTVLLAAGARGRERLRRGRKERSIAVVVKQARPPEDATAREQYALALKAQELYGVFLNAPKPAEELFCRSPFAERGQRSGTEREK